MASNIEALKQLACKDIYGALAAYTYTRSDSRHAYLNTIYTLTYLGLSKADAEKIYQALNQILGISPGIYYTDINVKNAMDDCLARLNITNEASKRIEELGNDDRKVLEIAARGAMKNIEQGYDSLDSDELSEVVSAMLAKDIRYEYVEKLFIGTLLAIRDHSESNRYYYYRMRLIPNTVDLIKQLAQTVSSEWPSYDYIYSRLKSADPHQVAVIYYHPVEDFYEAVYGYKVQDVIDSTVIEKIIYRGRRNKYIDEELLRAINSLIQEHCSEIMTNYMLKVLEGLGYNVDLKYRGFSSFENYCRYTAIRPGGGSIYIYVIPFAITLPFRYPGKDERAIIVVRGTCSKLPEYLERLKNDPLRSHMTSALWLCIHGNDVYPFRPVVKQNWQEEIIDAFRSKQVSSDIAGTVRTAEERRLSTVEFQSLDGVRPTREILEAIVAKVLENLGFIVSTNVKKEARRGSSIEVDAWAEKRVINSRFSIYVSCKNWNSSVDRSVVDEEYGRVNNLRDLPHLKLIVAKELTDPAREAAMADGFMVIELGSKADTSNAKEIYDLIYKYFNDLFTLIAPPRLREIASKVSAVIEELGRIRDELSSILKKS